MDTAKRDGALDFTRLPFLTRRRVAMLADCSQSTVKRSPLVPVGRRGRMTVYKTSDVLDWIAGRLHGDAPTTLQARDAVRVAESRPESALARLRELRAGAR